jgi:hypothetical protein
VPLGPPPKIIDEDGLFAIIRATSHLADQEDAALQQQGQGAAPAGAAAAPAGASGGAGGAPGRPPAPLGGASFFGGGGGGAATSGAAAGASGRAAPAKVEGGGAVAGGSGGGGAPAATQQLWVDKYKPRGAADLVGNAAAINTLRVWLNQWEAVHLRGAEPSEQRGAREAREGARGAAPGASCWRGEGTLRGSAAAGVPRPPTRAPCPHAPPFPLPPARATPRRRQEPQGHVQEGGAAVGTARHWQDQRRAHRRQVSGGFEGRASSG